MKRQIATVMAATGLVFSLSGCVYANNKTQECVVTDKDRTTVVKDGKSSSDMRIYTDCGVFQVGDNFLSGFNSADVYASLKEDHKYKIESGGWRIGFLSEFPTIINAKEINK